MNRELFVQNVKYICEIRGVKPTAACIESGAGKSLLSEIKNGHNPSDIRIEKLADYLETSTDVLYANEEIEYSAPNNFFTHKGVFENWNEILDNREIVFRLLREIIPGDFTSYSFDKDKFVIAALDIAFFYSGDELKLARWFYYNVVKVEFIVNGDNSIPSISFTTNFKFSLVEYYRGLGKMSGNYDTDMNTIDKLIDNGHNEISHFLGVTTSGTMEETIPVSKLDTVAQSELLGEALPSPVTNKAAGGSVAGRYGPDAEEVLEMYVRLDEADRGEIRGEMKHMLKAEKYSDQGNRLA